MDPISSEKKTNILIIGGGISGLTSALRLKEKDPSLQVTIMETTNTLGGQLRSTHLGEIGAKWITEDQCHIYRLLKYLQVPTNRRNVTSPQLKRCWEIDNGIWATLAKYELHRFIEELECKLELFKPGSEKSSKYSMHRHIHKRLFFTTSRKFMLNLVLMAAGTDAGEVSYGDFMGICYSCGGIKRLIDLFYEAPSSFLEFSSQELLEKIVNHIKSTTDIMYNRKVLEIYQYRDCVKVVDSENLYYMADVVIVAIPWNRMQDIKFFPPLPQEIQKAPQPADNTNYIITSFLATYKDGHWRTKQFSGKYLSLEPFLVAQEYRCTTICGYYTHEEGLEPLVRSIILHKLSENFGEDMLIPLEYVQHTFELNTMAHAPLTSPWNRVIWSSSAAAGTCFRGHLGGAVQSGIRAAVNALLITRPQLVTWQDIAEIQCHNYLPRRDITGFRRWLSAWNLYNTTMYTLFVGGLVVILCHSYKKLK